MTMTMEKPALQRSSGERVAGLVSSAQAGKRRGWEALVREFGGMVWAIARAHRLYGHDAADVAQTTWLRLFEHLDRVNEPARVGAWLATTARRECLRVLREAGGQVLFGDDPPPAAVSCEPAARRAAPGRPRSSPLVLVLAP